MCDKMKTYCKISSTTGVRHNVTVCNTGTSINEWAWPGTNASWSRMPAFNDQDLFNINKNFCSSTLNINRPSTMTCSQQTTCRSPLPQPTSFDNSMLLLSDYRPVPRQSQPRRARLDREHLIGDLEAAIKLGDMDDIIAQCKYESGASATN
jgi:hypothetical protein